MSRREDLWLAWCVRHDIDPAARGLALALMRGCRADERAGFRAALAHAGAKFPGAAPALDALAASIPTGE